MTTTTRKTNKNQKIPAQNTNDNSTKTNTTCDNKQTKRNEIANSHMKARGKCNQTNATTTTTATDNKCNNKHYYY